MSGTDQPVQTGTIENAGDVINFNGVLAGLPFNGYYRAEVTAPAPWPSWAPGATGYRLESPNVLTNSWHQGDTVMGPIGTLTLISIVDGAPPNPIADAVVSGSPITWAIYEQAPDAPVLTAPMTGNLAVDLATSSLKGVVDTGSSAAGVAGDVGAAAAAAAAKTFQDNVVKPVGGAGLLVVAGIGLLLLFRR